MDPEAEPQRSLAQRFSPSESFVSLRRQTATKRCSGIAITTFHGTMGSLDIPPPSAPPWLMLASTACLGSGIFFWLVCYVLMTQRSLQTQATPMPLFALGLNLSWEVFYAFYLTEMPIEMVGFALWLLFDIPVVYATLQMAKHSFASSPLIARNAETLLGISFGFGLAANYLFAEWWLAEPHRGYGVKTGKFWYGVPDRDTTELAWWSAGVAQMVLSIASLCMLLHRGHSGGQSNAIW